MLIEYITSVIEERISTYRRKCSRYTQLFYTPVKALHGKSVLQTYNGILKSIFLKCHLIPLKESTHTAKIIVVNCSLCEIPSVSESLPNFSKLKAPAGAYKIVSLM